VVSTVDEEAVDTLRRCEAAAAAGARRPSISSAMGRGLCLDFTHLVVHRESGLACHGSGFRFGHDARSDAALLALHRACRGKGRAMTAERVHECFLFRYFQTADFRVERWSRHVSATSAVRSSSRCRRPCRGGCRTLT
jgi:hypothetical protein